MNSHKPSALSTIQFHFSQLDHQKACWLFDFLAEVQAAVWDAYEESLADAEMQRLDAEQLTMDLEPLSLDDDLPF